MTRTSSQRVGAPRRAPAVVLTAALVSATLGSSVACVSVPSAHPLQFDVDDDELRGAAEQHTLEGAAQALREDPDLYLLVVGHADEDNTDEYNRALSKRRAEHIRARLLALDPALHERIEIEARGEWDAKDRGTDEAAKAHNRRVELRFYYPRRCEPSFDSAFLACEWARLPEPELTTPVPVPATEPVPEAESTPPSTRERQDFVGPYLIGIGGYAVSSSTYLRQQGRWGLGAGYLWGFGTEFRIALGLDFDHLIDVGFVFPQSDSCHPFCAQVERSRVRAVPELRIGGARGGLWGWLRLSAGLVVQHREAERVEGPDGMVSVVAAQRWDPGAVFGIGPGLAITLTTHLILLFEATVSYAVVPAIDSRGGGVGIYDVGAGLGWIF